MILLIVAVLTFSGCETIQKEILKNSIRIDSADGVELLRQQVSKHVDEGAQILRISAVPETRGEKIQIIDVYFYDREKKGTIKRLQINLLNESMNRTDVMSLAIAMPGGRKAEAQALEKFDFNQIPENIAKAKSKIPSGHSYFGVGPYELFPTVHTFELNTTKDGEGVDTKAGSRRIEVTYYPFNFVTNGRGDVQLRES